MVRAMRAAFDVLGGQPPGLGLRSLNAIPHGRGLGSSAAAIVTGILAARGLATDGAELLPDDAVLALATSLEGHPDNVAACLHGGLTIAWVPEPRPSRGRLPRGTAPAPRPPRLVPAWSGCRCWRRSGRWFSLRRKAWPRGPRADALPAAVPHRDAAANAARSALLVAALTRAPEVLFDATQDYLHQRYRAQVMPRTADLLGRLRAAGVAAMVSGAGPSVLALTVAGRNPGPDLVDSIAAETGIGWRISPLAIDRQGATLQTAVPGERSRDSAREAYSGRQCLRMQFLDQFRTRPPGHPWTPAQAAGSGRAETPQDWPGSSTTHGPVPRECCGLS